MKYTAILKKYNNYMDGSPQNAAHKAATPERNPECFYTAHFVAVGKTLWKKTPKLTTGVINQRTVGGKWELCKLASADAINAYLERIGAVAAEFRGGPRFVK
jgi:hypothetical protein